jgi:replicative DNA helicase
VPSPELLDRLPPQDLDAEKAVLGSIILEPSRMADVEAVLGPDDFYADKHRRLFRELQAVCGTNGGKLDAQILLDHLRQAKALEVVGGVAYVAEVASSVPLAANADYYAATVVRKSAYRQMLAVGHRLVEEAYDEADVTELLERTEQALAAIGPKQSAEPSSFQEIVLETIARIDEVMRTKRGLGLPTGMLRFDENTGGLHPGELFILAARPSVGKTALAIQIARYNAEQGRAVYFASLEMSRTEITTRMLCGISGVNSQVIRSGQLVPEEMGRLAGPPAG